MHSPETTLSLIRRDVAAWRRSHRRGPLPVELRRRAGLVAQFMGGCSVADALGVDPAVVERWSELSVTAPLAPPSTRPSPFASVSRHIIEAVSPKPVDAPVTTTGWCVQVTKPCGTTVRVQGPMDPASLEAVVRSATATR